VLHDCVKDLLTVLQCFTCSLLEFPGRFVEKRLSRSLFVSMVGGWAGRVSTMWCVGPLFGQWGSNGGGGVDVVSDGSGSKSGIDGSVRLYKAMFCV
jgi:hypothetical protein